MGSAPGDPLSSVRLRSWDLAPVVIDHKLELRRYAEARGGATTEYLDHGVSGTKDADPHLTHSWRMPVADAWTCSWCGDWIDSAET